MSGDLPEPASLYGYTPTTSVCFTFIVLFAVSAIIHGCEAVAFRLWWFLPLACLAALAEVFGWLGRLWSSFAPASLTPYTIQICATVIAPTPLIASNFMILGMLIRHLGEQFSRLSPKLYSIIFTSSDVVALLIQAYGGATASSAVSKGEDPERGGHIMLIGIAIQMVAITFYVILATEFFVQFYTRRPVRLRSYLSVDPSKKQIHRKMQWMIFGLGFSTVCLFIRTVYRTIELVNGFTGRIIRTQVYFNVLDGAMVVLASYTLNLLHPGYLLADVIEEERKAKSVGKDGLPLVRVESYEDSFLGSKRSSMHT
ncbi:RTA1 like protein-domain-containing protein [Phellopilus nigrolimitatus]|nr:RTA1 like protein-domain-containing protein [Phellopilus nigrolimitatus]